MNEAKKPARILVVDDEDRNRRLVAAMLEAEGYTALEAADGAQALELARQSPPDLVLLDIMMPGMDGYEVARALKADADTQAIPIVMVTALDDRESRLRGLEAGAEEFVTKPVDRNELRVRVRNLVRLKAFSDHLEQLVQERTAKLEAEMAERKLAQDALTESELRFRQIAENIREVFFLTEQGSNKTLYVSPAFDEIFGRSRENQYADPLSWAESIHPDDRECVFADYGRQMETGEFDNTFRIVRPDGAVRWVRVRGFPIHDDARKLQRIAGIVDDVTESKLQEDKIARLTRIYAVLSSINTTIVRTRDRRELFEEACRIAVEQGKFRLAWIGLLDANGVNVTPVARAGVDEGYLDNIQLTARDDAPDRCEMVARALRDKTTVVCNDIATDPQMARWREEALRRGYRSVVVFPLQVGDKVMGLLLLYAAEMNFFDTDEMRLLTEVAGDVSFALDHLEKEQRLDYLAYYDVLTGLANRALLHDRLEQRVAAGHRDRMVFAVIMLNLERFRNVNETLGQHAGDELLRQVARRLNGALVETDILARVSADSFAIVTRCTDDDGTVLHLLEQVLSCLHGQPFEVAGHELRVVAKAGVAMFPADGEDADRLSRNAEAALEKTKRSGDRYLFYTPEFNARVAEKLTLENKLRRALERGELVLHYQPKIELTKRRISGMEALMRWNDPDSGLVPPLKFIPLLEETGLILEAGRWALEQAVSDSGRWKGNGLKVPRIAVNVSPIQLRQKDFVATVERVLGAGHVEGEAILELEITESLIMQDIETNIQKLRAVRDMGVEVTVDDFGTGYSSLSYIAKLPISSLKIDRAFIINMTSNPDDLSIVSTIISLGHSLRLKVVAEGVETEEQANMLRLLKCDEFQGYLFSPAVPAERLEILLRDNISRPA